MRCHTNLGRDLCEAVAALVCDTDFGELGEVTLEGLEVIIEVMPIGLGMAPDVMENDKVKLQLVGGRDPGGAAVCSLGYQVTPKVSAALSAPEAGEEV